MLVETKILSRADNKYIIDEFISDVVLWKAIQDKPLGRSPVKVISNGKEYDLIEISLYEDTTSPKYRTAMYLICTNCKTHRVNRLIVTNVQDLTVASNCIHGVSTYVLEKNLEPLIIVQMGSCYSKEDDDEVIDTKLTNKESIYLIQAIGSYMTVLAPRYRELWELNYKFDYLIQTLNEIREKQEISTIEALLNEAIVHYKGYLSSYFNGDIDSYSDEALDAYTTLETVRLRLLRYAYEQKKMKEVNK